MRPRNAVLHPEKCFERPLGKGPDAGATESVAPGQRCVAEHVMAVRNLIDEVVVLEARADPHHGARV